jgi:hypothetical protein
VLGWEASFASKAAANAVLVTPVACSSSGDVRRPDDDISVAVRRRPSSYRASRGEQVRRPTVSALRRPPCSGVSARLPRQRRRALVPQPSRASRSGDRQTTRGGSLARESSVASATAMNARECTRRGSDSPKDRSRIKQRCARTKISAMETPLRSQPPPQRLVGEGEPNTRWRTVKQTAKGGDGDTGGAIQQCVRADAASALGGRCQLRYRRGTRYRFPRGLGAAQLSNVVCTDQPGEP